MTRLAARVTDGVAQADRTPEALEDGYFLPQERRLHDHIALLRQLSRHVRAVDRNGVDAGSWRPLFDGEIAVAMARLIAAPSEPRRSAFASALRRDPAEAAALLRALALELRDFAAAVARSGDATLAARLDVGRKDSGSGALLGLFSAADADNPAAMAALAADGGAASFGADAFDRARAARRALLSAHEQLLGVVEGLRPDVVGALEARLASGAVEPALGLVIANLGLLGVVEAEINGFAPRHRRFYHGEVLGQRPRGAAPETVLLRMVSAGFPAPITEGEQIEARAPGSARPQMFRLLAGVLVSPVEAAEARTLLFERDPDISLQRSLGYVTAVRAAERRIDGADAADARRRLFAPEGQERAALGIEVDSDMLRLREGVRRVEAAFRLRPRAQIAVPPPDAGADAMVEATAAALRADRALHDAFADTGEAKAAQEIAAQAARCDPMMSGRDRLRLACLRCATSPDRLRAVLGAIVAETLVEGGDWPDGAVMAALLERLQTLFEDGSGEGQRIAQAAREWFAKPPTEVYQLFLSGGFAVSFSTAEGFVDAPGARAAPNRAEDGAGFRVRLTLDAAQPPIAPAPGAQTPTLRLRMAGESLFCTFSLFERYLLAAVRIEAEVEGMTRLTARGDGGAIAVEQPFAPFGPAPRDGAGFTIGAAELAVKPITDVSITLSWSGLPRAAGGFETHYRDYGPNFTPPRPQLAVSWLAQGGARSLGPPQSMLRETPGEARLAPDRTLRFAAPGAAAVDRDAIRRIAAQGEGPLASGAVRIELRCGEDAFGHAAYPAALAAALRPSYNPLRRRASPSPPHTPTIDRVTLNYRAEDVIDLGAPHAAAPDQRLRHITPFGTREIFPGRADMSAGVFAERLADGALFLQIAGPPPVGALSLLFHLEESSHRRLGFTPKPVRWRYLAQDGWRPLGGSTLVSDSTDGLMRSGVVRIAPPADAARRSSEMPGEGLWLAACADGNLGDLPRLRSVMVNGARAVRVLDGEDTPDPPGPRKWRLAVDAGRVADVRWVAETVSGAAPETERAFHTRVAERLRHRQRAVTSWDVERLALELFPQVWKAKCFPVMDPHTGRERAGAVTLIVVPHAPAGVDRDPARPRMFDVLTLRRIEETLAALAPDGARLTVGNPSYDRLQVRARVVFARDRDDGSLIQRLERDVSRMLSVWTAAAPMNGFGWSISLNEVAGFMAALDYIDFVTRLSLLQLSRDDAGRHQLRDTARSALGARASLRWDRPWSLPLATRLHRITAGGLREAEPPAAAGLGALAVGAMLVVGSGAQ